MIDLQVLRDAAMGGSPEERVPLTRGALAQIVRELVRGRAAEAALQAERGFAAVCDEIAGGRIPTLSVGDGCAG